MTNQINSLNSKLEELVDKLKIRKNRSYIFFEKILINLPDEQRRNEMLSNLLSSFSIVQYANFNSEEEKLLSEIWMLAKAVNEENNKIND